jgi:Fe-S-cluster containining protein
VTTCNGCGSCCAPVTLPFTQDEARKAKHLDPYIRWWVLNVLEPMPAREAKAKEPFIFERPHVSARMDEILIFTYRCRWFDEERRVCGNYEARPPGCRTYPWKGQPDPQAALPPTCSFRADIGQPVEPHTPVPVHFVRKPPQRTL